MTQYDHDGDKITSTGPDGHFVIDFSKFKDIWTDSYENVESHGIPRQVDWEALMDETPERPSDEPVKDMRREKRVLETMENIDIVEEAKERRILRDKPKFEQPPFYMLPDLLGRPVENVDYKIVDLWPSGGNVLFAAPAKFGKSTMVMNLIRSLCDGTPFLGHFRCPQLAPGETVLLIDLEMSDSRVTSELRAQAITNEGVLGVAPLRGRAKDFDITNPEVRRHWVRLCQQLNVKTIIIDPLAPLLGHLNTDENDNSMVNRFFQQLDEFKAEAGIRDMMVVHHCGHSADWRPRGASRFNDWPDALWLAKINGGVNDPTAPREFFARGRDIWETLSGEGTITQDPTNSKVLLFDTQSGSAQQTDAAIQGEIENLFSGSPNLVRWDRDDDSNKKVEVIALVVSRLVANNPDVNTNRVETVLDRMATEQYSIHTHAFSPAGRAGRAPWRIYPADRCPHH